MLNKVLNKLKKIKIKQFKINIKESMTILF
jgi:hypothetical protein